MSHFGSPWPATSFRWPIWRLFLAHAFCPSPLAFRQLLGTKCKLADAGRRGIERPTIAQRCPPRSRAHACGELFVTRSRRRRLGPVFAIAVAAGLNPLRLLHDHHRAFDHRDRGKTAVFKDIGSSGLPRRSRFTGRFPTRCTRSPRYSRLPDLRFVIRPRWAWRKSRHQRPRAVSPSALLRSRLRTAAGTAERWRTIAALADYGADACRRFALCPRA
jgi:hypothetical protein